MVLEKEVEESMSVGMCHLMSRLNTSKNARDVCRYCRVAIVCTEHEYLLGEKLLRLSIPPDVNMILDIFCMSTWFS